MSSLASHWQWKVALCYCVLPKAFDYLRYVQDPSVGHDMHGCPALPTNVQWDLKFPIHWGELCMRIGHTGNVPVCPTQTATLYPSHCTMGRTGCTGNIPVRPTLTAAFLLSIPSHCNMGMTGRPGNEPVRPNLTDLFLLSIPFHCTYHGKDGTHWERTSASHPDRSVPTVHSTQYHCTSVSHPLHPHSLPSHCVVTQQEISNNTTRIGRSNYAISSNHGGLIVMHLHHQNHI